MILKKVFFFTSYICLTCLFREVFFTFKWDYVLEPKGGAIALRVTFEFAGHLKTYTIRKRIVFQRSAAIQIWTFVLLGIVTFLLFAYKL